MERSKWMLALTLTMLPTWAAAQLGDAQKIVVRVPFEFVAGNRVLPAGQYTVRAADLGGAGLILNNPGAKLNMVLANLPDESKTASGTYAMVFKKYGNQHFLWKIRIKGSRVACRLPESKAEAELRASNIPVAEEILRASRE